MVVNDSPFSRMMIVEALSESDYETSFNNVKKPNTIRLQFFYKTSRFLSWKYGI